MPIYDYKCHECHASFEIYRLLTDTYANCPTCKKQMDKLMSGPNAIHFKGSGFYETDYKGK